MKNIKGFTLIEMQVSLVIASILVLAIGVVAGMSTRSYNKLQKEAQIFNDITYGFKLMENRVRRCRLPLQIEHPDNLLTGWITGERLIVGNEAFGLFSEKGGSTIDWVHLPDKNQESIRDIIMTFPTHIEPGEVGQLLSMTCDAQKVEVRLKGKKEGVPFNLAANIKRRVE